MSGAIGGITGADEVQGTSAFTSLCDLTTLVCYAFTSTEALNLIDATAVFDFKDANEIEIDIDAIIYVPSSDAKLSIQQVPYTDGANVCDGVDEFLEPGDFDSETGEWLQNDQEDEVDVDGDLVGMGFESEVTVSGRTTLGYVWNRMDINFDSCWRITMYLEKDSKAKIDGNTIIVNPGEVRTSYLLPDGDTHNSGVYIDIALSGGGGGGGGGGSGNGGNGGNGGRSRDPVDRHTILAGTRDALEVETEDKIVKVVNGCLNLEKAVMSCVNKALDKLVSGGMITEDEKSTLVLNARRAHSGAGGHDDGGCGGDDHETHRNLRHH